MSKLTIDSHCTCVVNLVDVSDTDKTLVVGTDVMPGCTVIYSCNASVGGYCRLYDAAGVLVGEGIVRPESAPVIRGGAMQVNENCSTLQLSASMNATSCVDVYIRDIVTSATSLDELYKVIAKYNFDEEDTQEIVNVYLSINAGSGGGGGGGTSAGISHKWEGTTLVVTSDSGTTSADLQGPSGKDGADGVTPQKGVDYYTEADKAEFVDAVLAALPVAEEASF